MLGVGSNLVLSLKFVYPSIVVRKRLSHFRTLFLALLILTGSGPASAQSFFFHMVSASQSDTTPDAFSFTDAPNVAANTLIPSNALQITGLTGAAPVTISGGGAQYRVCTDVNCTTGTAWQSGAGTINNNQFLQLQVNSSPTAGGTVNVTITVGGVVDTWSVTSVAMDTTPDSFSFTDLSNLTPSTLYASNLPTIQLTGFTASVPVTLSGGVSPQFRVCTDSSCSTNPTWLNSGNGNINSGQYLQVRTTSSSTAGGSVSVTVTVGGTSTNWTLKNQPVGYFVMLSAGWGPQNGLSGANSACLSNLTNAGNNWLGKAEAQANNQLVSGKVRAFLCSTSSCQNPVAGNNYYFALSGNASIGGQKFTAGAGGSGPGDTANWSGAGYFGGSYDYWTGRAVGTSSSWGTSYSGGGTCVNWTTNSSGMSDMGDAGLSSTATSGRWFGTSWLCGTGGIRLICMVDP